MFSPKLYTVKKFPLSYIVSNHYNLCITNEETDKFCVKQQDNMLFRQIRLVTGDDLEFQKYITFVNCKGGKSLEKEITKLAANGFKDMTDSAQEFDLSERSASMTRTGILSFLDHSIADEINRRITMDIQVSKTVLSKLYAYRGLMLSSCHCLEQWYPKIVIVPDCYKVIPNQRIKYAYDKETQFVDKEGNTRNWVQKDIAETCRDVEINVFDGCGIHHPSISKQVKELIGSSTPFTTILWRAPYIKGVTNEMDYEAFFLERGITQITDIWGQSHDLKEPMILMTESMYKGKTYFEQTGTYTDWKEYWRRFKKYEHCIGVTKWNDIPEEEDIYTRSNYQILQDLDMPYESFAPLAKDSIDWIQKIIDGDPLYTYCFLGLFADKPAAVSPYAKAILKNPEMLKEYGVRNYLISLTEKYKNDMKAGKLWLKSSFKFLVPDPIMLMEHIGGLPTDGCLLETEFYSFRESGPYQGEHLIERNPHICKSEHVILKGVTSPLLEKYCSHLANTCIINGKSITPQRLNGADFDGDLVLVIDNPLMMKGVDQNAAIVLDTEDKITSITEEDTKENRLKLVLRTMNNLIGETSNCATAYHNKTPKTAEQKEKYESYIDLLSIINGKAIDFAKTGVLFHIPMNISKFAKPLPYFMKYAGAYYSKMKTFSHAKSNLNRLCRELEKWDKGIRYKRTDRSFDYHIMIDEMTGIPTDIFAKIEHIYLEFCREMNELGKEQAMIRNYDKYKEELEDVISKEDARNFTMNWSYYYETYRRQCLKVCPDIKMLANIAVLLCYEKYPAKNKKFIWCTAADGILFNLKQKKFQLPRRDNNGNYEYLGRNYRFADWNAE